jgi:hypothetical protein
MVQQSAKVVQIERRSPERQVLFHTINALKAAEADLAATRRAVSDDFNTKITRQHELGELHEVARGAYRITGGEDQQGRRERSRAVDSILQ